MSRMRKSDHISELQGDANLFARLQSDLMGEQAAEECPRRQAEGIELAGAVITCLHNLSWGTVLAAQLHSLWPDEDVNMPLTGVQAHIRRERHVPHFCGNAARANF